MSLPPFPRSRFWLAVLGAWLQRSGRWNGMRGDFEIYLGSHFIGREFFGG